MTCKLNYKGQAFDDIRSLTRFINLERMTTLSSTLSMDNLSSERISTYDASNDYGLEVEELYNKEEEVISKFDACGRR